MPKLKAATQADGTKFYPVTITNGVYDTDKSQVLSATLNSKYEKPANGIPKSDLNSGVRTSLNKADSALQSETDPVFTASPAYGISSSDITSWNDKVSNVQSDWNASSGLAQILNKPTFVSVYSGSSAPASGTGSNGDIYIQVAE